MAPEAGAVRAGRVLHSPFRGTLTHGDMASFCEALPSKGFAACGSALTGKRAFGERTLCLPAQASIATDHSLGGSNNTCFFPGDRRTKIEAHQAGHLPRALLLAERQHLPIASSQDPFEV